MNTPQTNLPNENMGEPPMAPAPHVEPEVPAWKSRRSIVLLLAVAVLGLTADLVSKHLAFAHLPNNPLPLIRGILSLDRSLNLGALFGIGEGKSILFILASALAVIFVTYMFASSSRRQWVVHLALGLVLAGALGNLYDRVFVHVDVVFKNGEVAYKGVLAQDQRPNSISIGRYPDAGQPIRHFPLRASQDQKWAFELDRNHTAVRDFIRVDIAVNTRWTGPLHLWPWIFNIADAMLVVGVSLLLIIYWRHPVSAAAPSPSK